MMPRLKLSSAGLCLALLLPTSASADHSMPPLRIYETGSAGAKAQTTINLGNYQPTLAINQFILTDLNNISDISRIRSSAITTLPSNALELRGTLLSRDSYPELFNGIGDTYGSSNSNTFQLPDLRGRATAMRLLGQTLGSPHVTLNARHLPGHTHDIAPILTGSTLATGSNIPIDNHQPTLGTNYYIATTGLFPQQDGRPALQQFYGQIAQFASDQAPPGWVPAQGQSLSIHDNLELYSVIGTNFGGDGRTTFKLPDFTGRIPIGAHRGPGLSHVQIGTAYGESQTTLHAGNLPAHSHTLEIGPDATTQSTGTSQPINNRQLSLGINFLIAIEGQYPAHNRVDSETTLGEIVMFGGNYVPGGYAFAHGQLLPISGNEALYSLIGTVYGGDGRTTFALPDLRGRTPVHYGQGTGLPHFQLGHKFGSESIYLEEKHLPIHNHFFEFIPGPGLSAGDTDLIVNQEDLDYLKANFGNQATTTPHLTGDIIGEDGTFIEGPIGLNQLAALRNHFGYFYGKPPAAIPTPSSLALLSFAGTALFRRGQSV